MKPLKRAAFTMLLFLSLLKRCDGLSPRLSRMIRVSTQSIDFSMTAEWGRSIEIHRRISTALFSTSPTTQTQASVRARSEGTGTLAPTAPVVVNVYVDTDILKHLNMHQSQRKGRFLFSRKPPKSVAASDDEALAVESYERQQYSIQRLRDYIENKSPSLKSQPYTLRYKVTNDREAVPQQFTSDDAVKAAIATAVARQSSLQLFVQVTPGVLPPPDAKGVDPLLSRLSEDPADTPSYTLVSFYAFAANGLDELNSFAEELNFLWRPFKAHGRVYVAKEGVNAQMAVPTNVLDEFFIATRELPLFSNTRFNTDHVMPTEQYHLAKPFKALHIRVRDKIVADGFEEDSGDSFDWTAAGNEMKPIDWHQHLVRGTDEQGRNVTILDCRNSYESDVGIFEGAIPLNTTFFRESWSALEEILEDIPKDAPILTYCTGGIRCVKINAYLQQKMGFTNTHRLQGGIISYTRELESMHDSDDESVDVEIMEASSAEESSTDVMRGNILPQRNIAESKFRGVNYVFDERVGARVTQEVLTNCEQCGSRCDAYTNCPNHPCNVRFLQCPSCAEKYNGYCSKACEVEHQSYFEAQKQQRDSPIMSRKIKKAVSTQSNSIETTETQSAVLSHALMNSNNLIDALSKYCERLSNKESSLLQELRRETEEKYEGSPGAARMISGALQGQLLAALSSMTQAQNIIELGSFTGYSAVSLAEGLERNPANIDIVKNRIVTTCEIDPAAADVAEKYFARFNSGESGSKIILRRIPADQLIDELQRKGELVDLAFIDADKKKYRHYLERLLGDSEGDNCILRPGALIVVDNTLWKGLVINQFQDLSDAAPAAAAFGNEDRMNALALSMHNFNKWALNHPYLQPIILPFRDGLTVIRFSGGTDQESS